MTKRPLNWKPDLGYPTGKGATEQHFLVTINDDDIEIDTHPWGEADLKINDETVVHVDGKQSAGDAFRKIEPIAEEIEDEMTEGDQTQPKS